MNKNNEKDCVITKISNACLKNEKIYGNFKLSILICAILFAIATVFYLCFGLNFSQELTNRYVINVDFKSTISDEQIIEYKDDLKALANENGFYNLYFDEAGEVTTTNLILNIIPSGKEEGISSKLTTLTKAIEDKYIVEIPQISVGEAELEAYSFYNFAKAPMIALGVFTLALFIFVWIRFEILTALSSLFQNIFGSVMLFALLTICRVPISATTPALFGIFVLISTFIYLLVSDKIRQMEISDSKLTNKELVVSASKKVMPSIMLVMLFSVAIILVFMIYLIAVSSSAMFIALTLLIVLALSFVSGFYFAPSFWVQSYRREKDRRLNAKIERLNKKEQEKATKKVKKESDEENEKIMV